MNLLAKLVAVMVLTMMAFSAVAQNGVVVSQTDLPAASIERIYLGQSRVLTGVNLPEGNPTRIAFEKSVVGKTGDQLNRHWAKLKFTGRATPLDVLDNDKAVIEFLKSNPQGIGYVADKSLVTGDLKILTEF